jgi:hypothetical protein
MVEIKLTLPELERLFDNITLESVLDVVEALKNNCRDSFAKDKRFPAFCGILKETEGILQKTYNQG